MKMRFLEVLPEVRDAVRNVVALESTIITHGMPYPRNLEVARGLEAAVRAEGAVPATIAIMDGRAKVGLTDNELERLATSKAVKCSTRDIAGAVATGRTGGTTVAATAFLAAKAGVSLFATGGIGGVHFGDDWDVSADLVELGRQPVLTVCSGCKSILDAAKTLQVLETHGAAVLGYQTDLFATFFTKSDLKVPARLESPQDIAKWVSVMRDLGLKGGIVAVPHDGPTFQAEVSQALREQPVTGKDVTPWLLARIEELTGGASLEENVKLVTRNARIAARAASTPYDVVVVGATALDVIEGRSRDGGVARNVAEAAGRAGARVQLVTAARSLANAVVDCVGVETDSVPVFFDTPLKPPEYDEALLEACQSFRRGGRVVILDLDLPDDAIDVVMARLEPHDEVWLDPTTVSLASRAVRLLDRATLVAPNLAELDVLSPAGSSTEDKARNLALSRRVRVVATLGDDGVLFVDTNGDVRRLRPHRRIEQPHCTVGAGDTLLGVTAAAWTTLFECDEARLVDAIDLGARAAELTLASSHSVAPSISSAWLRDLLTS